MATYGNYYRPRYERMGDFFDPMASGVGMAPPSSPATAPPPSAPPTHPAAPPDWQYRPGTPGATAGSRFRRSTGRTDAEAPDDVRDAKTTGQTAPPPPPGTPGGWGKAPPPPPGTPGSTPGGLAPRAYQGGALAYYGTGNIAGAEGVSRGNAGTFTGFNEGGWGTNERGTNSIKNVNGRIFSRYPAKPSSIDLVMQDPDFRALFPNARKVGFDKIDYGDGVAVDVLKAADPEKDVAEAWAWMPDNDVVPDGAGRQAQADIDSGAISITPPDTSRLRDPGTGIAEMPYTGPSFRDWIRRERGLI